MLRRLDGPTEGPPALPSGSLLCYRHPKVYRGVPGEWIDTRKLGRKVP